VFGDLHFIPSSGSIQGMTIRLRLKLFGDVTCFLKIVIFNIIHNHCFRNRFSFRIKKKNVFNELRQWAELKIMALSSGKYILNVWLFHTSVPDDVERRP
jgi:hypothetical protein